MTSHSSGQGKLALVTGASTGIGLELARLAARDGYDLLVAADTSFADAEAQLRSEGVRLDTVEVDLSTFEGVDKLLGAANGRRIDVLCANAGHGLGHAFLDQDPAEWRHVIDTNITGTIYLIQKVAKQMVGRGEGKVLITGSVAGHIAGTFQAVYNGTKAFVDSFSDALGNELKDTGVSVTCLKPGPTDTEFFERADLEDTKVGQAKKDDPAKVAETGWEAMIKGQRSVVYGWSNQLQTAVGKVLGGGATAALHRGMAEPGSGKE